LALSTPTLYGLRSVLQSLIELRGALNSIDSALRADLSWRPLALITITSAG